MIAEKIVRQAIELKTLVAAGLQGQEAERGIQACNALLAEAERVAGLEAVVIRPEEGHA